MGQGEGVVNRYGNCVVEFFLSTVQQMAEETKCRDFNTEIECPTDGCEGLLVHRYECTCGSYWGYCNNDECVYYYCPDCRQKHEVSEADLPRHQREKYPRIDYNSLSKGQRENLKMNLDLLESCPKERAAIRRMFSRIASPDSGYDLIRIEEEKEEREEREELRRVEELETVLIPPL